MYDVITIGGATLDIFLDIHEASLHCLLDKEKCMLCIKYGEKIPVDALHYDVGGNAANVAVGLARLGVVTGTYLHYGSDEISQKIVNVLQKEKVGTEFLVKDEGETSSIGIAINFQGERTLFVHHIKRNHKLPAISIPKWIYLTSVGDSWEQLYRETLEFVKTNNVALAFSPGTHQLKSGVDSFIEQVKAAKALFVNREEGLMISKNITPSEESLRNTSEVAEWTPPRWNKLLVQLQQLGPQIVSVTDGKNGAYAMDEKGQMFFIKPFPHVPKERTGAGDSYAAGFLSAIILDLNVPEAMRWGAVNAASVISEIGAEKGLLKKEELEKRLSEHSDFKAELL